MYFKMNRTQTGDCGTLHADVPYNASNDPKLAKEARAYIERGFARGLTEKEVKALTATPDVDTKAKEEAAAKEVTDAKAKEEAEAAAKAKEEAEAAAKAALEAAASK